MQHWPTQVVQPMRICHGLTSLDDEDDDDDVDEAVVDMSEEIDDDPAEEFECNFSTNCVIYAF